MNTYANQSHTRIINKQDKVWMTEKIREQTLKRMGLTKRKELYSFLAFPSVIFIAKKGGKKSA